MLSIERKSLLYKSGVEYADFCLNHVEGCSHGCTFPCYAFLMKKRFGVVRSYNEWRKPKIVRNALELLQKELPKYAGIIEHVHLCFSTDPFMYGQHEVVELTLKIIETLNAAGIRCTTLTKGLLPLALSRSSHLLPDNEYGITLISLSEQFRLKYEPYTSPYADRIKSLKALRDAGLRTWVSVEPYPPPNIVDQDFHAILETIAFTNKIVFGRWNYNAQVSEYREHREYYNDLAWKTIDFCMQNGIKYHIKDSTQTASRKQSGMTSRSQ